MTFRFYKKGQNETFHVYGGAEEMYRGARRNTPFFLSSFSKKRKY